MDEKTKRTSEALDLNSTQVSNESWWTDNTMSYDWKDKATAEKFSEDWFADIDRRFIFGARLFAHAQNPFDQIIPFESLEGKEVLEIGCGMGLHTELLVKSGAIVTSIDISKTSVTATKRRLELKGLAADIVHMDAVEMSFADDKFDFIWSWGVIHHSAKTASIIKQMHRVMKPGGMGKLMVYNLSGTSAYLALLKSYLFPFWRGSKIDDALWKNTDGFMARYYTADSLTDLMSLFFTDIKASTLGQDVDAIPLPNFLRRTVVRFCNQEWLARLANSRGGFLFMEFKK